MEPRERCSCFSFVDVWLTRLFYQNGLALWASLLFYESCLSLTIGLSYSETVLSSTACLIGSSVFLFGLLVFSVLENLLFPSSLSFTLSPWLMFVWLISGVVFSRRSSDSSSLVVVCFLRLIFVFTCLFTLTRVLVFIWRYRRQSIPTFQSPRIYSLVDEPRPF